MGLHGYLLNMPAQRSEVNDMQDSPPSFRPVIETLGAIARSHAAQEDPALGSAVMHAEAVAKRLQETCARHALVVVEFAEVRRRVGPAASVEALTAALLEAYQRAAPNLE